MMFLISVVSFWVIGAAFLLFFAKRSKYVFSVCEFTGMSLFIGMSLSGFLLFFYDAIGLRLDVLNLIVVPVVAFAAIFPGYMAKPYRVNGIISDGPGGGVRSFAEKMLFWGIVAQVLWVFFLTIPLPVHSHDAVANYALKAKMFFFSSGIPYGFFSWGESTVAHPDYPLFLPLVMTWVYAFTGFNDVMVKLIMPLSYVGFIAVFFSVMRKLFDRPYAILATFILATIPQLADYGTIIHADIFLTLFVTVGFLYFMRYTRTGGRFELFLASFMIGSSVWIKNEAMVFSFVFAVTLVLFFLRSEGSRRKRVLVDMLGAFTLIVAIASPWFLVRSLSGVVNSDLDIMSLDIHRVLENFKALPSLLDLFQQEVFGPKKWNIFWVIFFGSVIWKRAKIFKGEIFYLSVFIFLAAFAYFAAYMAMTGENLYFYVNTTISRFMLHFSGVCAVLIGYLLYDDIRLTEKEARG
jgi:4-amino-4-deoxy-L-arabinose transferase-like glycosyltransferase